jgi:hypothetical protein
VADFDIVEVKEWNGDVRNMDNGNDKLVNINEDEKKKCKFSEGDNVNVKEVIEDLEKDNDEVR